MMRFLFILLAGCATASQRVADQAALRDQEARAATIHHPRERVDATPAFDTLGGRYRILSMIQNNLCFESMFQSENGNEYGVQFYLTVIDPNGEQRTVHHNSAILLGMKQTMISTDNDSSNASGAPTNAAAQAAVGLNEVAPQSTITFNSANTIGGVAPIIQTPNTLAVDPVVGNGNENRLRTYAVMRACFTADAVSENAAYLVVQRGDIGLMNPHPLRAVWKLVKGCLSSKW